ncbi:methionyl-tRNA formyltransferase [Chrysiogenes arsenatis]|uniref:methionyl-tRNA formyltransferase n=1 Tax=Chrysiogenes arsenatis TaxID=309797 RepID=UPI0003FC5129|nr:methionyl-tRNA formyltransferase [Chrysiogenes arsenatis]
MTHPFRTMRVGFMGTPEFSVASLHAVADHFTVPIVITQPDKPAGRKLQLTPSAVKVAAQSLNLPVVTPDKIRRDSELIDELRTMNLDAIVVVAYGQILPQALLDIPRFGCYNIHASLLPKLRGAAPIHRAITDGETETGITIIRMDAGLDTGDMVLRRGIPIGNATTPELHNQLKTLGAEAIISALYAVFDGSAVFTAQDHAAHTYARKLTKEEAHIDWTQDATVLANKVRGLTPWPGTETTWQGKRLKVLRATPCRQSGVPGTIVSLGDSGLEVACGNGSLLLGEVQLDGKKPVSAADFIRGHHITAGEILG